MFRKPKKQISRRVFSGISDEEVEEEKMSVDVPETPPTRKKESKSSSKEPKKSSSAKLTLLSFGDDEGTCEFVQIFLFYQKTRAFNGPLVYIS